MGNTAANVFPFLRPDPMARKLPKVRIHTCRVCGKRFLPLRWSHQGNVSSVCSEACNEIYISKKPHACFFCGNMVSGRSACVGECTKQLRQQRREALLNINAQYFPKHRAPSVKRLNTVIREWVAAHYPQPESDIPEWFLNLPVEETTSSSNDEC